MRELKLMYHAIWRFLKLFWTSIFTRCRTRTVRQQLRSLGRYLQCNLHIDHVDRLPYIVGLLLDIGLLPGKTLCNCLCERLPEVLSSDPRRLKSILQGVLDAYASRNVDNIPEGIVALHMELTEAA
jgi:hypothetical protein